MTPPTTATAPAPAPTTTALPLPVMHHVCIVVADLARTREFYVEVLGCEEEIRPTDFVFKGAYFRMGAAEIHVVQEHRPGRLVENSPRWERDELRTGLVNHFAVMVEAIPPYIERLRERGLDRVGGYRVRDDFVEQVYIADPDGNVIELLEQHSQHCGQLRRQEIFDDGTAVPVAPGYPLVDPRAKYGSF